MKLICIMLQMRDLRFLVCETLKPLFLKEIMSLSYKYCTKVLWMIQTKISYQKKENHLVIHWTNDQKIQQWFYDGIISLLEFHVSEYTETSLVRILRACSMQTQLMEVYWVSPEIRVPRIHGAHAELGLFIRADWVNIIVSHSQLDKRRAHSYN